MIRLIAIFLPILSAGGPPEPTKAEPPLEALVPGRWRGMMTADGKTTHMTIGVKEARQGFVGESLMWFALTEDEAHNAQFGALPRQVMAQFLSEAAMIAVLGALSGLFVGGIGIILGQWLMGWQMQITGLNTIYSMLIPLGLALAAGAYPALRAARLDPMHALRG